VDSLAQQLEQMLNSISPAKLAMSKYMYTIRQALLHSPEAYKSSIIWRVYNVDIEVDSNVSRKALKYYKEAEQEFQARNYASAARLYRRALDEQPAFYKASLYLGDAFYASENYADAIRSFQESAKMFPDQLEPRKYLTDAYSKMKMYDKALQEAIGALSVYPDLSIVAKLNDAAYLANKRLDIGWTSRAVFPNKIERRTSGMPDLNRYSEEEKPKPAEPWTHYTKALERARPYCDTNGVITKPEALDGSQYLELYSWQEMLRASNDPSLSEARKMQQAGYLDCYVLVTCFHPDIYNQYRHFVTHNRERVTRYFKTYLKDI
jgi:tetratricopeptide (TPR) repeat protein